MSAHEQDKKLKDVEYAIAQQRLEGLTVSAETEADMRRSARGDISIGECLARIKNRHAPDAPLF